MIRGVATRPGLPTACNPWAARRPMNNAPSHSGLGPREHLCPACGSNCKPTGEQLSGHSLFVCCRCGLRSALEVLKLAVDYNDAYASRLYPDQTVEEMRRTEKGSLDASLIETYAPFFRLMKPVIGRNGLLDVGCGGGRFCRAAARRGWKTLGIDVSELALEYARAMKPLLDYRSIDIAEIAQTCGQFDVVTAFEVVEHQSQIREFLKHIRAALNEEGLFLCTVPAWEHPDVRSATRPDWVPPVHLLFFTRASLSAVLTLNGFEVLRTGYIPMRPCGVVPQMKWFTKQILNMTGPPLGVWALAKPAPF
jgi:SAM-dependent methyltransferase